MSLLIGPDTTFIRMGKVLLLLPDTTFIKIGSVLANTVG